MQQTEERDLIDFDDSQPPVPSSQEEGTSPTASLFYPNYSQNYRDDPSVSAEEQPSTSSDSLYWDSIQAVTPAHVDAGPSVPNTPIFLPPFVHDAPSSGEKEGSTGGTSESASSSAVIDVASDPLLKQDLHKNGRPKRPLNSFMIFSRARRPELQKVHPELKIADIARHLAAEWKDLPPTERSFYHEKAKIVKENFHRMFPNYVYSRRPNNTRHRKRGGSTRPSTSSGGSVRSLSQNESEASLPSPGNSSSASSTYSFNYGMSPPPTASPMEPSSPSPTSHSGGSQRHYPHHSGPSSTSSSGGQAEFMMPGKHGRGSSYERERSGSGSSFGSMFASSPTTEGLLQASAAPQNWHTPPPPNILPQHQTDWRASPSTPFRWSAGVAPFDQVQPQGSEQVWVEPPMRNIESPSGIVRLPSAFRRALPASRAVYPESRQRGSSLASSSSDDAYTQSASSQRASAPLNLPTRAYTSPGPAVPVYEPPRSLTRAATPFPPTYSRQAPLRRSRSHTNEQGIEQMAQNFEALPPIGAGRPEFPPSASSQMASTSFGTYSNVVASYHHRQQHEQQVPQTPIAQVYSSSLPPPLHYPQNETGPHGTSPFTLPPLHYLHAAEANHSHLARAPSRYPPRFPPVDPRESNPAVYYHRPQPTSHDVEMGSDARPPP